MQTPSQTSIPHQQTLKDRDVHFLETLAQNLNIPQDSLHLLMPESVETTHDYRFTPEDQIQATVDEWCDWLIGVIPTAKNLNPAIRRHGTSIILSLDKPLTSIPSNLSFKNSRIYQSNPKDPTPHIEEYLRTDKMVLSK